MCPRSGVSPCGGTTEPPPPPRPQRMGANEFAPPRPQPRNHGHLDSPPAGQRRQQQRPRQAERESRSRSATYTGQLAIWCVQPRRLLMLVTALMAWVEAKRRPTPQKVAPLFKASSRHHCCDQHRHPSTFFGTMGGTGMWSASPGQIIYFYYYFAGSICSGACLLSPLGATRPH